MKAINRTLVFGLTAAFMAAVSPAAAVELSDSVIKKVDFPENNQRNRELQSTKIIFVGPKDKEEAPRDSAINLIARFYLDQFRHFQDPRSPYFMFMSKDAKLALGIGGVVRMRGWFDWNGSLMSNGFSPYFITIPKDPTSKRRLSATPAGTAVFMTLIGTLPRLGDFMAYIEGGFNGYNNVGFKLKKAYVSLNDFTVGLATSTFSDPASQAPVIDGSGSNGKIDKTAVLVRYMHTFRSRWTVAASFEFPSSSQTHIDSLTKKCTDYVPDICAMAQYQWNGNLSHVRLSAMFRTMGYRNLMENRNHYKSGWGVMLSSTVKVGRPFTLYGSVSIGKGNSSYLTDLAASSSDLIPDPDMPGRLYEPTALGVTAGLKVNFRDNLYSCASFGTVRNYLKGNIHDSSYKQGYYGAANIFWDITPRLQVGAEYLIGSRRNFDGTHGCADRVDALFQLSF